MMPTSEIRKQAEIILAGLTAEQKLGQLQCMFAGAVIPVQILQRFPNGLGALALNIGIESTEESIDAAKEQQDIVLENCGIPALRHAEALTGVLTSNATIFPAAIGMSATWNPDLVEKMADLTRKQMVSIGIRHALSPVMDVARDPRWGRVGETYGEDPTLCATMSVAFTKGLQSEELSAGVLATGKHFLGYGTSQGGLNMTANSIPPRELREVYAKPFQAAISEAGLGAMMNSYGTIDGEMVIESRAILNDLLRDEMGFDGIVVSDYMSINRMVDLKVSATPVDGAMRALRAGLDIELPSPYGYIEDLLKEIEAGSLDKNYLDEAVLRILMTKLRLGILDNPYGQESLLDEAYDVGITSPESLKAARESIVLLKNDGLLPLRKDVKKIAVIGPHADSIRLLFGCYTFPAQYDRDISGSMSDMPGMSGLGGLQKDNPYQMPYLKGCEVRDTAPIVEETLQKIYGDRTPTILASLRKKAPEAEFIYEKGCEIAGTNKTGFADAIDVAKAADVVILVLGGKYGWGTNCTTGEGIDCDDIGLPGVQEELAKAIIEVGKPSVFVHMDAKSLSSEYVAAHFGAVLENWYPGESGGQALADVLFGDYNPSGRLPITAPRNAGQIPIYASTQNGSGYFSGDGMVINRYVEGRKDPLYYFGEGYSFTTFAYTDLQVDSEVSAEDTLYLSCDITNMGQMDGEEVVQVYVSDDLASMVRPAQELAGFYRVKLRVGERKTVHFAMKVSQFAFLNTQMQWHVEAGSMTVKVGASSHDIRLTEAFEITNTTTVDGKTRGFYAKAWE
ncbi:MAG: glycoside hydrolase family 3 C-terminal domain-containing protein [Clostridiales Family XIII bacterium]|nr:glycoside hydrolase family 3 C-terminal domain-containing protein [Clostridiales Family XIII bacterium]